MKENDVFLVAKVVIFDKVDYMMRYTSDRGSILLTEGNYEKWSRNAVLISLLYGNRF